MYSTPGANFARNSSLKPLVMKSISKWTFLLGIGAALSLCMPHAVLAQDVVKVAPAGYNKVLLDNEHVRVLKVEMKPGVEIPWHSHPNHVVYAETSGKVQLTEKDKPAQDQDIKAGTAIYVPAVTHMAKNIGKTTIKLIMVEMKD